MLFSNSKYSVEEATNVNFIIYMLKIQNQL